MLRLWPERLTAGLFPDVGWVQRAGGAPINQFSHSPETTLDVTDGLGLLLQDRTRPHGSDVELVVSDSFARIVYLPWQDSLSNNEQGRAYARACLEQAAFGIDESWVVQAAFRHYRGGGIGFAFPRALITGINANLEDYGLRLRSLLPLTAVAYWRNRTGAMGHRSILVIEEYRRVSALLFDGRKCAGIHVQPTGSEPGAALRRLLSTVEATYSSVKRVQCWSTYESSAVNVDTLKAQMPQANITALARGHWN